jgi:hypothetical protein
MPDFDFQKKNLVLSLSAEEFFLWFTGFLHSWGSMEFHRGEGRE